MGINKDGEIVLIDEIHTPDSSRYWIKESYNERLKNNLEPQNIDKEFLRLWFVDNCDPYNDSTLPDAPEDLIVELSKRYIYLYETITGEKFTFPNNEPIHNRINNNLKGIISSIILYLINILIIIIVIIYIYRIMLRII